ncbi:preprotein translocase subunit SecE [Gordonibacter urolithinfaciens]|uniref:preprotein translocase subunit SecE n=1 Tax=Gordonibacter urolithinfaciens TaxID=1335613 RepID=UPI003AB0A572
MAKKSKTQRAKASAARAARKAQALEAESAAVEAKDIAEADAAAEPKKRFFKKADKAETPAANKQDKGKIEKKVEGKPKKRRFGFLKDVRAEMKRVTWPTKKDVLRWSVVVVAALLFFGVYVALLDNVIITPVLVGISSLGA